MSENSKHVSPPENDLDESFRDHLSTIDESGKRVWIYPKKSNGKFTNYRKYVAIFLYALFFTLPFVQLNGQPLLLLNVLERHFILFGIVIWPQDFFMVGIAMLTSFVGIVLFTVIYGRLFCGWICPQTLFMEWLFRPIEYFIEGDFKEQMLLDKAPLSFKKIFKKTIKHIVFFAVSFVIANYFLMYMISYQEWKFFYQTPVESNFSSWIILLVFTFIFYYVYAKFREQVCTTVCPYGRLQGVLLDRNSVVVAYDYVRGEKRHLYKKGEDRIESGFGDCIDCHQCVNVCPTGIDIRNGTQLECINCTACMDACDYIMEKIDKPQGLIRYASEATIKDGKPFKITKRIIGYSVVLLVLLLGLVIGMVNRSDVETSILRTPGLLSQEQPDGRISNMYDYKIINKTNRSKKISLRLKDQKGEVKVMQDSIPTIHPANSVKGVLYVIMQPNQVTKLKNEMTIEVLEGTVVVEEVNITFIAPNY
jgi:cytochrome c oxidase accessory protein FixG